MLGHDKKISYTIVVYDFCNIMSLITHISRREALDLNMEFARSSFFSGAKNWIWFFIEPSGLGWNGYEICIKKHILI